MIGTNLRGSPIELIDINPGEWGLISIGIEPDDNTAKLALCVSKNQDEGAVRLLLASSAYTLIQRYEIPNHPIFRLTGEFRLDLPPQEFRELDREMLESDQMAVAINSDGTRSLIASQKHARAQARLLPLAFSLDTYEIEDVPRSGFYWASGILQYRPTDNDEWTPLMVINGNRGGWSPFGE